MAEVGFCYNPRWQVLPGLHTMGCQCAPVQGLVSVSDPKIWIAALRQSGLLLEMFPCMLIVKSRAALIKPAVVHESTTGLTQRAAFVPFS
jgi:hypothetical protein